MSIKSADVFPFSDYNGTRYCYFGVQAKTNQLSSFGGFINRKETPAEGAAREFEEESLGAFGYSQRHLVNKLNDQRQSIKVAGRTHVTFLAKLDTAHKNPIKKFDELLKKKWKHLSPCQKEVKQIVAVAKSDLISAIAKGQKSINGHVFRDCVYRSLVNLYTSGVLLRA